jgi:hypothetical protein
MLHRSDHRDGTHALAQGLGWFSVGLGLAELLAPARLGRLLGMEEHTTLIRAYGARELAVGIGILAQDDPEPWLWGRVGGDALDLGTLAMGMREGNPQRENAGLAFLAVAGVTALDVICASALARERQEDAWSLPVWDYSHRRGMPRPPEAMRGVARDAPIPRDMRTPEPLRPYATS